MRVLLACLLLLAFNVRGDESQFVPREDVVRYLTEMETRHQHELEQRDEYIRKLEALAAKARNFRLNCRET